MTFTYEQTRQLLAPIKPNRVLKDGKNNSHVSQQDVTAHLIRVFGFGNFSTELLHQELLFEVCRNPDAEYKQQRWDVAYRATMRVTIQSDHEEGSNGYRYVVCSYEDSSVGDAQNQVRHDAHDLALKSAISLAKKRCCINLGDQFGLSLYNKGQMNALVGGTLVLPSQPDVVTGQEDLQDAVPQQESLGTDESVHDDHRRTDGPEPEPTEEQHKNLASSVGAAPKDEKIEEAKGMVETAIERSQERDHERKRRHMFALFTDAKFPGGNSSAAREERIGYVRSVLNREDRLSSTELDNDDLDKVIAGLEALIASEKDGATA